MPFGSCYCEGPGAGWTLELLRLESERRRMGEQTNLGGIWIQPPSCDWQLNLQVLIGLRVHKQASYTFFKSAYLSRLIEATKPPSHR